MWVLYIFHGPASVCCCNKILFFEVFMDEQKMTIFQRDKLKYYLRNGDPLPMPKLGPPKLTAQQQYENQLASQIIMRANSARKRTLNEIQASGAFQQEKSVLFVLLVWIKRQ